LVVRQKHKEAAKVRRINTYPFVFFFANVFNLIPADGSQAAFGMPDDEKFSTSSQTRSGGATICPTRRFVLF